MQKDQALCKLCGEPMPEVEQMFKYHGYSGPCPKKPIEQECPHASQPSSCLACETVDQSLDEKAIAYQNKRYDEGHGDMDYYDVAECFKAGSAYQAPISRAEGEAEGFMKAIEHLDLYLGSRMLDAIEVLKEEAKRRCLL